MSEAACDSGELGLRLGKPLALGAQTSQAADLSDAAPPRPWVEMQVKHMAESLMMNSPCGFVREKLQARPAVMQTGCNLRAPTPTQAHTPLDTFEHVDNDTYPAWV